MNIKDRIKKIDIEKKNRYIVLSVLITLFIYVVTQRQVHLNLWQVVLIMAILVVSGNWIANYPSINKQNFFFSILMPFGVLIGALSSLYFYPNLGLLFKLLIIGFFGGLYYLVLLVDNIFLVVHDREEIIPLYRVAVTWSQIIQVVIAIPLFAGVLKTNTSAFLQSFLIALIYFLFTFYQLWIYQFDSDAKTTKVGEIWFLCMFSSFVSFAISFALSFFSTKAFLRSLFIASILLFMLSYISGYLKNEISRKMVLGYLLISGLFLSILLFFLL